MQTNQDRANNKLLIAAIIAVHNRLEFTQKCLDSLDSASDNHNVTVILIDDGSTDGTSEWIASHYPHTIILSGDGTLWFGGATQMGIDYALACTPTFDYVLTINNDTFLLPKSLDLMVDVAKQEQVVAATYLYAWEGRELISTAGYLWKGVRGLIGICHTPEWNLLQQNDEFVKVDSVATTATLFPTKFLLNSCKISLQMHPHHRYDVMLSATCRDLGAGLLCSTKPLAIHIYEERHASSKYKQQTFSDFWKDTFFDPLQVNYLPGILVSLYTAAPSKEQAIIPILKILTRFLFKFVYVMLNTLFKISQRFTHGHQPSAK
jgi:N-acetylglucosaminyl-diphospho-decaprenol L-rhamnosyltransferase